MNLYLQNLNTSDLRLLFRITENLSAERNTKALRQVIAKDLIELLRADFLASFIWDEDRQIFDDVVFLNMSPSNIKRYREYYHLVDPITFSLQKRRRATLVSEIMPQKNLEKTEFFNDFLMEDGLHHGINLYAYDGKLNIGDLRIWRKKRRPSFGKREAVLLDTILPYFRNALIHAKAMEEYSQKSVVLDKDYLKQSHQLSNRESDIALLVCKGLTDHEIASALGIAFSTVRTHIKHLFLKLGVTTRTEILFVLLDDLVDISY